MLVVPVPLMSVIFTGGNSIDRQCQHFGAVSIVLKRA
jgi:hypothetical protein